MQLQPIATVTVNLKPPVMVGPGPYGVRVFVEVSDGVLESELDGATELRSISGKVLPGGGDWALLGADGWCRLDVRTLFETSDGATIYARFPGLIEMTEQVQSAFALGRATEFDDQYFRVTPHLETGDANYSWVNQTVFVGEGRFIDGFGLHYRMYRVG
ncbi:MAG TPA: DUF3237 domain-containing protein [Aldersonia sp.]